MLNLHLGLNNEPTTQKYKDTRFDPLNVFASANFVSILNQFHTSLPFSSVHCQLKEVGIYETDNMYTVSQD